MIFEGYFNNAYTVKELSLSQAEAIFKQSAEDSESLESLEQLINNSYSYRTRFDISRLSEKP